MILRQLEIKASNTINSIWLIELRIYVKGIGQLRHTFLFKHDV